MSLCTSRPHSPLHSDISVDPPDWADDEKSGRHARDVVEKLAKLCAPLTVDRSGMHTVNVFTADRLSEQKSLPPLFRRLSSLTPPIEGDGPWMGPVCSQMKSTSGSVQLNHDKINALGISKDAVVLYFPAGTASSLTEMWTAHRKELEVAIHKEKGKDHADPAPDLLSQEDRLRRRLSKLNMDMSVCRGDGNCLVSYVDILQCTCMNVWRLFRPSAYVHHL